MHGRLLIVLAAFMWSTSGAFTKVLTQDTALHLQVPELAFLQIAFYRALFAGLTLLPSIRRRDISFRGIMLVMMLSFGAMNALFVLALAMGTAANAIFLQYTAPMWMYLASVWWLGEPPDRRSTLTLAMGLLGVAVIIIGGWKGEELLVIAIGLGSGITYAAVVLCLRVLRAASSRWLAAINLLFSALVLVPVMFFLTAPAPSPGQWVVLFLYGALQMGIPYWLMAHGLRSVSPQEAGTITLLEPLLNPLWAYLVCPETEVPSLPTWIGGACILGALAWRYWPRSAEGRRNRGA